MWVLTKKKWFKRIEIKMTNPIDKLDRLYVNKDVRLHGVLVFIISDYDPRFTFHIWPNI